MEIGTLVKHRVADRIGIIVRNTTDPLWSVVHWNNGMLTSVQLINLVSLC